MITSALAIICWIAFCIFEGRFEAILWHLWSARPLVSLNPHRTNLLVLRRGAVLIIASLSDTWLAIPHILVFAFVHNGAMYSHRNDINPRVYTDRWQSDPSQTSTAKINFTFQARTAFFIIGIFDNILIFIH